MKDEYFVVVVKRPLTDGSLVGDVLTVKVPRIIPCGLGITTERTKGSLIIISDRCDKLNWIIENIIPVTGFPKGISPIELY